MEQITCVIPTSPIRLHPSTEIIDETIGSIRKQLSDSKIIIMVDGVREEQSYLEDKYNEYKNRLLTKREAWGNLDITVFSEYSHQAKMLRETLDQIDTPIILFTEHDMPLKDREFDWAKFVEVIQSGEANVIRFCMEHNILPDWQHMMLDKEPQMIQGVPLLRTLQWSQRTHLASVDFYKMILSKYFNDTSRTFIEDKIHGYPGQQGWDEWKLWIYAPEGDMQYCYTTDGRKDEPKYGLIF